MAPEDNNSMLRLLREIREAQTTADAKAGAIAAKLDKLTVEVIGVKGRLRKVEEGMEAIARCSNPRA